MTAPGRYIIDLLFDETGGQGRKNYVNGDDSLLDVPTDRGLWSNPVLYSNLYELG